MYQHSISGIRVCMNLLTTPTQVGGALVTPAGHVKPLNQCLSQLSVSATTFDLHKFGLQISNVIQDPHHMWGEPAKLDLALFSDYSCWKYHNLQLVGFIGKFYITYRLAVYIFFGQPKSNLGRVCLCQHNAKS